MKERIQKLLSRAGYGSRREIERWIEAGEILVNGKVAELGQPISESDKVILRGKTLHLESKLRATPKVLMYHKKAGEMCTRHDPEGRPTVFDNLPHLRQGRWIMIGRLDVNTDGLLLFTTDGELANKLMHPSSEVEREYATRILGEVTAEMLQRLQTGVQLEDGPAHFLRIMEGGGEGANHWYHVVLAEGRNREVRRLWESQGLKVSRLIRVRYGFLSLPRSLRGGQHEELDVKTLRRLYESVGMNFEEFMPAETAKPSGYRPAPKDPSKPRSPSPYRKARTSTKNSTEGSKPQRPARRDANRPK
ncbi:MAG: pseudouridine synthase [Thiothrix sp.]|nr:MAG: pseudouridine synthase [Thiothrix sp.]